MFARIFPLLVTIFWCQLALAAPATLTVRVSEKGTTATLQLVRENIRGLQFELLAQNATGAYDAITPVAERSYLGTVDEFPGAVSYGILQDDGVFKGGIIFDRGGTWNILGQAVTSTAWMNQPWAYGFSWETVGPGQGGSRVYGYDVGIDARYEYFDQRGGGSFDKTLEMIEFSLTQNRALYIHDALLRPFLARVIIRAAADRDPARGLTGGLYLDAVRNEWNNHQKDADRDVVAGIATSHVWAGLAWVGVIATPSAYSVNDSQGDGNFNKVWQHELGHNWGLSHYDGGAPEKGTINSDNHYARISGPELRKMLDHRDARLWALDDLGPLTTVNIPPYASYDSASFAQGRDEEIVIDVMANDHDANGHEFALVAVESDTIRGGSVRIQEQMVVYTPRWDYRGVDSFTYRIQDASGQTATGAVAVDVQPGTSLRLYLPLDEIEGTTATDQSSFQRNGALTGADFATASTTGRFGQAVELDGVEDYLVAGGVRLHSNTVTLSAWIKPAAPQNSWAGIIFDRGSTTSGLNIGGNGELRYHWNNTQYQFDSKLVPAMGVWTYVALVVEPTKATLYLNDGSGFRSAVNYASHARANFGTVHIGWDPGNPSRRFHGAIDEVRMYDAALTLSELEILVQGGAAESPFPYDGAREVDQVDLSWSAAAAATRYHVYLGTDAASVQNATVASPEYLGAVSSTRFSYPPTSPFATHFWRVDTETAAGTISGKVWSFSRSGMSTLTVGNFSFEDGPLGAGVPPSWRLISGNGGQVGAESGGTHGNQKLYIGPNVAIGQTLAHTLIEGEEITLAYDFNGERTYARKVQLIAKQGGTETVIAETTTASGSGSWPTVTLKHTVAAASAGKQLAIRVESSNWNEFDHFRVTSAAPAPISLNDPPVWSSNPIVGSNVVENFMYQAALGGEVVDPEGGLLTFSKVSGPSWLTVASDGTLVGTPTVNDRGLNLWVIRVSDAEGASSDVTFQMVVRQAEFFYDLNGAVAGSGAAGGGSWTDGAEWSADPNGASGTFPWQDGGTAIFSAGTDATSDYRITNLKTRQISGLIARSGAPQITDRALQLSLAETPFVVEADAVSARIDSPLTGRGGLLKAGPGPLLLGGNHAFTGNLKIEQGVVELLANAKLYSADYSNTATITIASGGTWRMPDYSYGGVGQLSDYRQRRVLDGGTIEVTGPSHASGQDFTVTSNGGTFRYNRAGGTLTLSGNTNTNIRTEGALNFDHLGNLSIAGASAIIEGPGSVVKTGRGQLTLAHGANSFTGDLTVLDGKLLATAAPLGTNSALGARIAGRTLAVQGSGAMEWTVNDVLGGKDQNAANLPTLALTDGSLQIRRFNLIGHVILDGGSLVNSTTIDPQTYDGFQFLGSLTAIGTKPSLVGTTNSRGNHLLGGGVTTFSVSDENGLLTVHTPLRNGSGNYPGVGSLRKTGLGTLHLTAVNPYTGTTTVEAGTLLLDGTLNSATTVAATGTLTGTGSLNASVTVQAGGTLAPSFFGTLSTGPVSLASGSTLLADGTLSVTGDLALGEAHLETTLDGPRVLVRYTGTRTGEFVSSSVPAGWEIEIDDVAREIRLVAAPQGYAGWIESFATGSESGFDQDADFDGISNGLEFFLGGDPTIAGDTRVPAIAPVPGGGCVYTFTRAHRAREATLATAQFSDDLVTWPSERERIIGLDTATSSPGVTIEAEEDHDQISIEISGEAPRTFIRLRVTEP